MGICKTRSLLQAPAIARNWRFPPCGARHDAEDVMFEKNRGWFVVMRFHDLSLHV